jgi:glycosyl transferase, family 25
MVSSPSGGGAKRQVVVFAPQPRTVARIAGHVVSVVVISLARSADRRAAVRQNLDNLDIAYTFFDAVDGRAMSAADIAAIAPRPYIGQSSRPLSDGEIGCAASFRAVLTRFLNGTDPFLCIAEDDASFAPDARHFLDPAVLHALPAFDVIRLVNDPRRGARFSRIVAHEAGYAVHAPLRLGLYMFAQIFSRAGAQAVLSRLVPLRAPIDNLIYRDVGIPGLRVLEVRPPVVTARNLPSMIGERFEETAERQPRGLIIILRRKMFLLGRRLRSFTSYVRAWGAPAVLQIRVFPNASAK